MVRKISGAFTGGALGALIDSVNIWVLGQVGITAWLGVALRPQFTASWLYPRLVWGGIWAMLLILPLCRQKTALRGILMSLVPTTMMLVMVFPEMGLGLMGLKAGLLTPLLVLLLNFIYGMAASFWYKNCA
ncbi:MAG: hypothetical protein KKE83_04690 [Proteobacteria bacterium]|nr:hypothetical protein [Pseudomonadota bacterium]MBU1545913.1 hypothetical protein [Pseudomonadota bacterium]MBU2618963.1 hypothetical protein [Pseudomonadota bacterium]